MAGYGFRLRSRNFGDRSPDAPYERQDKPILAEKPNAISLFRRPRHRRRSSKRKAFDEWYHREHLPDAVKAFGVKKAWRFWSVSDPALHQASYEFADQPALDRVMNGDALKALVAEFDRCWPEVKRTREIFVLAEEYGAG